MDPFRWPSALLECLPSKAISPANAAKGKAKTLKQEGESSSDEDKDPDKILGGKEILDTVTQHIDNFLHQARNQDGDWSEMLENIANGMFVSAKWIQSMNHGSKSAYDKLTSTMFEDITTTAEEICAVMGKAHWAASGLLVVAAVIHTIYKVQRIDRECLELLTSVNTVGKSLSRFSHLPLIPDEMKSTVNEARNLIAKSAACCFSIIQSRGWRKYISANKNTQLVSTCCKQLERLQRDLGFQLIFADYSERHEPKSGSVKKNQTSQANDKDKTDQQRPSSLTDDKEKENRWCGNCMQILPRDEEDDNGGWHGKCMQRLCNVQFKKSKISSSQDATTTDGYLDDKDAVRVIEEMLDLKNKQSHAAVAVFLCGGRYTGKTKVADKVYANLETEWKKVKIPIHGESADEESVLNMDIVPRLRSEILRKLEQKGNDSQEEMVSDSEWQRKLSEGLRENKAVIICIQNVPSAEILKKVLPKKINPGSKIRFLLTIREKDVTFATEGTVFKKYLYIMRPMTYSQAVDFFRKMLPESMTYTFVVWNIIKICMGYKKQMRVVRDYLVKYYKDEKDFNRLSEWIEKNKPTFSGLRDYLTCEEIFVHQSAITKDALLDICSFFNKWEWYQTASILQNDVLQTLKELDLVTRESNKVIVPDKVMQYCLSLSKGVRITSASDLHTILAEQNNLHAIKGIWLIQNKCPFHVSAKQLDEMPNLRVLALGDSTIVKGNCEVESFKHLRYFQAGRIPHMPLHIRQLEHLTFLDNDSHHYIGEAEGKDIPPTLMMLRSKALKFELYKKLHNLPKECKLTVVDIEGEDNVETLPESFCELHALEKLILGKCKKLHSLPKSFGKLRCLKILDLSHCEALTCLPSNFGWLSTLEKINFSYCRKLKVLPESMSLLSSVKEIDLSYCRSIQILPKGFFKLYTLCVLNLTACTHLSDLPEGYERLALEKLSFEACKRLIALPINVGQTILPQKKVSLSWCLSLPEISKGFINLIKARVEELILVDCISLNSLPEDFATELRALKSLNLSGCRSLVRLPKRLHKLQYLERLNFSSCDKLEESSISLSRLPALKELNACNCQELKGYWLTSLSKIQSLKFIDIHDSPNLVDRWNQMKRDNKICHFTACTGRSALIIHISLDSTPSKSRITKEVNRGTMDFFSDKWYFVDVSGRHFNPSSLDEGTTLAVIIDHGYEKEEVQALGKILDDLQATSKNMQAVYIGKLFSELASELVGKHRVCSCDNYEAQVFFQKVLGTVESFDQNVDYALVTAEVQQHEKHKDFSTWTSITRDSLRAMAVDVPITDYLYFMELIETPQQRNIELLQALLLTNEANFLINSTDQMEITKLEGKFVFLLLSWLHNIEREYATFNSVYKNLKEKLPDIEVVWIPIVVHGRGTTRAIYAKWVEEIKFPSIADPWSIDPIAMDFFRKNRSFNKLPLLMAVSPTGKLYRENLIPKTDKKVADIIEKMASKGGKEGDSKPKTLAAAREVRKEIEENVTKERVAQTTEELFQFVQKKKQHSETTYSMKPSN